MLSSCSSNGTKTVSSAQPNSKADILVYQYQNDGNDDSATDLSIDIPSMKMTLSKDNLYRGNESDNGEDGTPYPFYWSDKNLAFTPDVEITSDTKYIKIPAINNDTITFDNGSTLKINENNQVVYNDTKTDKILPKLNVNLIKTSKLGENYERLYPLSSCGVGLSNNHIVLITVYQKTSTDNTSYNYTDYDLSNDTVVTKPINSSDISNVNTSIEISKNTAFFVGTSEIYKLDEKTMTIKNFVSIAQLQKDIKDIPTTDTDKVQLVSVSYQNGVNLISFYYSTTKENKYIGPIIGYVAMYSDDSKLLGYVINSSDYLISYDSKNTRVDKIHSVPNNLFYDLPYIDKN